MFDGTEPHGPFAPRSGLGEPERRPVWRSLAIASCALAAGIAASLLAVATDAGAQQLAFIGP